MEQEGYDQAYGKAFAKVYNVRWAGFATRVARQVIDLFDKTEALRDRPRTVLDVACGTGQLANVMLDHGFRVIGIDLSPHMIEHAVANNRDAVDDGRAAFHVEDAASFQIDTTVSVVVSTYDALNHLPDMDALSACFRRVYDSLAAPGLFVFDLNTAKGLNRWNGVNVMDTDNLTIINRGVYAPGEKRAYLSITGFARSSGDTFERFREIAYNTVFAMNEVDAELKRTGFTQIRVAGASDLETPVDDPESLDRAFFICEKAV